MTNNEFFSVSTCRNKVSIFFCTGTDTIKIELPVVVAFFFEFLYVQSVVRVLCFIRKVCFLIFLVLRQFIHHGRACATFDLDGVAGTGTGNATKALVLPVARGNVLFAAPFLERRFKDTHSPQSSNAVSLFF